MHELIHSRYHFRYGPKKAYVKGVYNNDDEYFADVAKAYQTELKILYDHGLRNAQVDDPNLAYFCSDSMLEGWKNDPENFQTADEQFDAYLKFYNECFKVSEESCTRVNGTDKLCSDLMTSTWVYISAAATTSDRSTSVKAHTTILQQSCSTTSMSLPITSNTVSETNMQFVDTDTDPV